MRQEHDTTNVGDVLVLDLRRWYPDGAQLWARRGIPRLHHVSADTWRFMIAHEWWRMRRELRVAQQVRPRFRR